jgi:hypothetical protein
MLQTILFEAGNFILVVHHNAVSRKLRSQSYFSSWINSPFNVMLLYNTTVLPSTCGTNTAVSASLFSLKSMYKTIYMHQSCPFHEQTSINYSLCNSIACFFFVGFTQFIRLHPSSNILKQHTLGTGYVSSWVCYMELISIWCRCFPSLSPKDGNTQFIEHVL